MKHSHNEPGYAATYPMHERVLSIKQADGTITAMPEGLIRDALCVLVNACHGAANRAGWWTDLKTGETQRGKKDWDRLFMLQISEIVEGFEGVRKGLNDDHLPQYKMCDVEQADAAIRIFDTAGGMETQFVQAFIDKLFYNAQRADHKPENRVKEGGKAF